ncbi:hypothetical protein SAMN06265371_104374 [Lutibacter agarilyticus]|uniref:Fibronectin type-III domain-containing protein n=1 Tax=Lutibacter agarilyticus TaxID=1109740 RepID=A0A238X4C7_9FLAO|nr:hypothetical protein [Lutibacter agarilyticus]SNR53418.1 hypothetical protein SAMN06265371_104374 [Lutibacter agarilyticus]
MKKFLYIAIIGIVIWSCGGGGDDPPTPPAENKPPTTPTTIYPANNDLCIDNSVNFNWNASTDPEGDAITYTVEVSENSSFSPISQTKTTSTTSTTISLEKGVPFYWRVRAKDSKNDSSANSTVVQFYTEGDGVSNHLPFAPVLVAPELNETVAGTSTTLSWTASDVDTGDTLTYDVYFGTTNPPTTKEGSNITANSLSVNLSGTTTYYWKVVVKDDKGGQTIGQIWDFKTD